MPNFKFNISLVALFFFCNISYAQKYLDVITKKTLEWEKANNKKDLTSLKALYSDSVNIYVKNIGKDESLKIKHSFFSTFPDYHQKIISDLTIKKLANGTISCEFSKEVMVHSEPKISPAYLIFKKNKSGYLIIEESDSITNKKLNHTRLTSKVIEENKIPIQDESSSIPWILISLVSIIIGIIYIVRKKALKE